MTVTDTTNAASAPSGLGGWLILPIIGLFLTPLVVVYHMTTSLLPAFAPEVWSQITPALKAFLIAEVVANVAVIALSVLCLVLMFRKSRRLPATIIALYLFGLVIVIADSIVANALFDIEIGPDGMRDIARSVIGCAIWIPYFRVSKRVKNTFVN